MAEHLAAEHDLAPPTWADIRVLQRPWFPAELKVQRADALVRAPAAPAYDATAETAMQICAEFFPEEDLPPRAVAILQELFGPS